MNDEMKTTAAILCSALMLAGCRSHDEPVDPLAPVEIDESSPNWFAPGALVPAGPSDSTDLLTVTLEVEGLVRERKTEWTYRRLTQGEDRHYVSDHQTIIADGLTGGYALYLRSRLTRNDLGTNITLSIQYHGSRDGIRQEGCETITVPMTGPSSGKVGHVTYKSEWRAVQSYEVQH
jgi:hypothetical protein